MGKQADVKSQTSGPFALTWQSIQGYGQLKQQQYLRLDNQSNCKVQFWRKKKLVCMSLYMF